MNYKSNKSPNDAWKKMDLDTWRKEMGGMRRLLSKFADIPIEDIQGARAPGLQTAGNITIQVFIYLTTFNYVTNYLMPSYCILVFY